MLHLEQVTETSLSLLSFLDDMETLLAQPPDKSLLARTRGHDVHKGIVRML